MKKPNLTSLKKESQLFDEILLKSEERVEEFKKFEWKKLKTISDCEIFDSEGYKGSPFKCFKSIFKFKSKHNSQEILEKVLSVYSEEELKDYLKIIEPLIPYYHTSVYASDKENGHKKLGMRYIAHFRTNYNNFFVKDRDYFDLRNLKYDKKDKKHVIFGCSVPIEELKGSYPKDESCVRAQMNLFYMHLKDLGENQKEMMVMFHSDPMGLIPSFIFNSRAPDQAAVPLRYYEIVKIFFKE